MVEAAGIADQQSWPAHRGRAQLVRSRTRHRIGKRMEFQALRNTLRCSDSHQTHIRPLVAATPLAFLSVMQRP
jgi:hypothetical protein